MTEQVFAQVKLLAGVEQEQQVQLLRIFCQAAVSFLAARLRDRITPEDCEADFVAAASLLALASFAETDTLTNMQQIQLGHVTVRPGGGTAAAQCLRSQAEKMMMPYCVSGFSFRGV